MNLQSEANAAPALQLGKEWRAKDSRFGLRLSGEYLGSSMSPRYFHDLTTFAPIGSFTSSERRVAVSLVTTMALTRGRVQPYVLSGVQIQTLFWRSTTTFFDGASLPNGVDPVTRSDQIRDWSPSFGLQAGAGLQARVGNHWLYTEIRKQLSESNGAFGTRSPTPLTFGIRF